MSALVVNFMNVMVPFWVPYLGLVTNSQNNISHFTVHLYCYHAVVIY